MIRPNKTQDLSGKIKIALDKAIDKVIADEKARDGYIVISDKDGHVKKIPAKDIHFSAQKSNK